MSKVICFFGDLIEQLGFRQRYFWNWGTIPEQNIEKTDKACFFNPLFYPGQEWQEKVWTIMMVKSEPFLHLWLRM